MSYSGLTRELSKVREVTFGVTPPAPAMKYVRALKDYDFNVAPGAIESNEQKSHRMTAKSRNGNKKGDFTIPGELSYGAFDELLEEALCGTWTPIATTGAISLAAAASPTNTFTRTVGSFLTDGFVVGQQINVTGFATNNITAVISNVTALVITVSTATTGMVVEVAAAARTITTAAERLRVGNTFRSSTFEDRNPDANLYEQYNGCVISGFDIDISPEKIVSVSFKGLARDCVLAAVSNAAIAVDSAAKTFTCAAGGFLSVGASFAVGQNIVTTGFTNPGNNNTFLISAVTDTVITCSTATGLVSEVAGTGKNVFLATLGAPAAAPTNDPYESFSGDINEGTADQTEATGVKISFDNSMKPNYTILTAGADAAASIKPDAQIKCTGDLSLFFENLDFKKKFLAGQTSALNILLGTGLPGGKSLRIIQPALQYTDNKRTKDSTIIQTGTYKSNYDPVTATCIEIQRIP